jgi:DNA-binding transcriptional regulator YiaG
MSNIAKVFREEILRLAKRQAKAEVSAVKRESVRLKKSVAELGRQVAALNRTSGDLLKKITPVVTTKEIEDATESAAKLRPTSTSLKKLRARLGLTQAQFGQLLGVSGQAVVQWATREGRVRMRATTLAALARIQTIGKREALRRLAAMGETTPVRGRGRHK